MPQTSGAPAVPRQVLLTFTSVNWSIAVQGLPFHRTLHIYCFMLCRRAVVEHLLEAVGAPAPVYIPLAQAPRRLARGYLKQKIVSTSPLEDGASSSRSPRLRPVDLRRSREPRSSGTRDGVVDNEHPLTQEPRSVNEAGQAVLQLGCTQLPASLLLTPGQPQHQPAASYPAPKHAVHSAPCVLGRPACDPHLAAPAGSPEPLPQHHHSHRPTSYLQRLLHSTLKPRIPSNPLSCRSAPASDAPSHPPPRLLRPAVSPCAANPTASPPPLPSRRHAPCRISLKIHSGHTDQVSPHTLAALAQLLLPQGWALTGMAARKGCIELVLDYTRLERLAESNNGLLQGAAQKRDLGRAGPRPEAGAGEAADLCGHVGQLMGLLQEHGLVDTRAERSVRVQVGEQLHSARWQGLEQEEAQDALAGAAEQGCWAVVRAGGGTQDDRPLSEGPRMVAEPACVMAAADANSADLQLVVRARGAHSFSVRCLGAFLPTAVASRSAVHAEPPPTPPAAADAAARSGAASSSISGEVRDEPCELVVLRVDGLPRCSALLQVECRAPSPVPPGLSSESTPAGVALDPLCEPAHVLLLRAAGGRSGGNGKGGEGAASSAAQAEELSCVQRELCGLHVRMREAHGGDAAAGPQAAAELLCDLGLLLDAAAALEEKEDVEQQEGQQQQAGGSSSMRGGGSGDLPSFRREMQALLLQQLGLVPPGAVHGDAVADGPAAGCEAQLPLLLRQHLADCAATLLAGCCGLQLGATARLVCGLAAGRLRLCDREVLLQAAADGDPELFGQLLAVTGAPGVGAGARRAQEPAQEQPAAVAAAAARPLSRSAVTQEATTERQEQQEGQPQEVPRADVVVPEGGARPTSEVGMSSGAGSRAFRRCSSGSAVRAREAPRLALQAPLTACSELGTEVAADAANAHAHKPGAGPTAPRKHDRAHDETRRRQRSARPIRTASSSSAELCSPRGSDAGADAATWSAVVEAAGLGASETRHVSAAPCTSQDEASTSAVRQPQAGIHAGAAVAAAGVDGSEGRSAGAPAGPVRSFVLCCWRDVACCFWGFPAPAMELQFWEETAERLQVRPVHVLYRYNG